MNTVTKAPKITDKGTRGYLKWLATDPAMAPIYNKIQPKLDAMLKSGGLGYLGDDLTVTDDSGTDISNISVDPTQLDSGQINEVYAGTATPTVNIPSVSVNTSTANSAPSTATPTSIASAISSLVGTAASGLLAFNNVATANQVNQIQLQRAQAGLPPLQLNTSALGLPQNSVITSAGISASTLLLLGGLALLFAMSKR